MHYFWRGDMPHFSSPLLFQRGTRRCRAAAVPCGGRAVDLGRPEQGAHTCRDTCGGRAVDLSWPVRGTCGCRAAEVPRPPWMARRRPRPARAGRSWSRPWRSPEPCGQRGRARPPFQQGWHPWPALGSGHPCRRGPARRSPRGPSAAGRDRRNLKLARRTGRGPAAASATPPSPAALPHFHTTFYSAHNAILR